MTRGLRAVSTLPALMADSTLVFGTGQASRRADAVLAWGRKPSADVARRFAERHGLPLIQLEDGFLRSVELGHRAPPLSVVVDDLGIYYDATTPSRLERLVPLRRDDASLARATRLMASWRDERLSKYNHMRDAPAPDGPYVLVVDQTRGDASIRCGLADESSFERMLEAALDEHPGSPVLLKVHPDVVAGRKRGHFDPAAWSVGKAARIRVCADDVHPASLLSSAQAVYTVTSQMGFEALLWGRPVRTFGMPFYAGWGLTTDQLPTPERRRGGSTLDNLAHAALIDYAHCLDPETGERCEVERLVAWMGLQRRMRQRFPATVHALGFSAWKRPIVRSFFNGSEVRFVRSLDRAPAGSTLAVWGRRDATGAASSGAVTGGRTTTAPARTVLRLEDGFLRSVGLGADLVRPLSWVIDGSGIYYDATAASGLETLLAETAFDETICARARALRERILQHGLTKYNVGGGAWARPADVARVVLVAGQVETDASITFGAPGLRRNIELLRAAREAAPDAWIVYKPHPDVVAGLRDEGIGEGRARHHCDEIVVDVPMGQLLDRVDEVHVMTSLAGFEGLLRGRRVVTHGVPFYAGWGLTDDRAPSPRRRRRLSLDELVAGALIVYPTYVSRVSGAFTTPEQALRELLAWRAEGVSTMPWMRRLVRSALRAFKKR
ncbi:MAG: beta-3-deoxy-D-manno-oct-2-ulosonic acid transferase [Rhizobacter sp.]|nr:beta-3-deoxy-D-manno-oct-2-ulosonic acid transferase [Rhizobacter sp.]